MKSASMLVCKVMLGVILCALAFGLSGCRAPVKLADNLEKAAADLAMSGTGDQFALPGETEAEGRRRRARIKRINRQEMIEDIEKALLMDKPSKLTDKRIP